MCPALVAGGDPPGGGECFASIEFGMLADPSRHRLLGPSSNVARLREQWDSLGCDPGQRIDPDLELGIRTVKRASPRGLSR